MRIDANMQENRAMMQRTEGRENQNKGKTGEDGVTIQASQLNLMQDSILERKKKAMQEAMGIINQQFSADAKIDENLEERRERILENKETMDAATKEIRTLSEEQEKLKETYCIDADSEEQKDLELRLKIREVAKPGSKVRLTEEDVARMKELGSMTDYQRQYMDLENMKDYWQEEKETAQKVITEETQIIKGTKQELLKYHGMVDAQNAAAETLKAASDEIVGMLMQEAQEQLEEKVDEAVERGEKLQEEREELEALREEQKAEREEQMQQLSDLPDVQQMQGEIEARIREILAKQKLLEEDLKGIQVDELL